MWKTKVALICLMVFAFTVPEPVLAANFSRVAVPIANQQHGSATGEYNPIAREEAMLSLTNAFPELTRGVELKMEQEGYSSDGHPAWGFGSPEIGVRPGSGHRVLSGSVDAITGRVLTMNYNPLPEYYRGKQVKLTREQALQNAQSFLSSMVPELKNSLKLDQGVTPSFNPNTSLTTYYSFSWTRMVDGVAVNWERVMVGVDAYTGLITHYNNSCKETQFSPGKINISQDQAIAILLNQAGVYPAYKYSTTKDGHINEQIIPVYELNTEAMYIDALTGKFLNYQGQELPQQQIKIYNSEFTPLLNRPAINEPPLTETEVDPRQAQETARQFLLAAGFEGEIIKSGGGGGSGPGYKDEHWFYSPKNDEDGNYSGLRVEIDAYTGEVTGFYKSESNSEIDNPVSWEQALPIARQAIKKYSPGKENLLALKQTAGTDYEPGKHTFTFVRLLNGIPFDRDSITVTISRQNGDLLGYQIRWRPVQCSSLNQLLNQTRVQSILAQQLNVELVHMSALNTNYEETGEPRLAYLISRPRVDALSGAMIYGGEIDPTANSSKAPWVSHWSAPALSMLNENGLLTGTVNPDEAITRREALKAVLAATNPRAYYSYARSKQIELDDIKAEDPDYKTFALAASRGIISPRANFNPDGYINREELAVWVIKSLGYDNIAQIKNPITTPVKDAGKISTNRYNYVGLAYGLGIITPDGNNNLRSLDKVSRAEMAIMASRILALAPSGY
ncbi:MAG: S-layer homology domain-containing protein [Syntrophomonadaceae bacterium]|nr:S-layer homology domain-containing protein [Syntrophomonadaceae bacterium]